MVGSLFSWKSLFTKRRTSEDWRDAIGQRVIRVGAGEPRAPYFAYGGLAEQHEFDTAARLRWRGCAIGHDGDGGAAWIILATVAFSFDGGLGLAGVG